MASRSPDEGNSSSINLWAEYSRYKEACTAVLNRLDRCMDRGECLSDTELSELRTMALNIKALSQRLHGIRRRDMWVLSKRASQILEQYSADFQTLAQSCTQLESRSAAMSD